MTTSKLFALVLGLSCLICSCAVEPQADNVYSAFGFAHLMDTTGGDYRQSDDSRGVLVTVEGTNLQTYTDSTGYFELTNVPSDKHTFYFYKDGYGVQRSTEKNPYYYFHSADDLHPTDYATFWVEIHPLSPLNASIDSVYYADTTYIHTYYKDLVVGPKGDTLDFGTLVRDTIHATNSLLTIEGSITSENGFPGYYSNVVLFFSTSPDVSSDSSTWIMNRGCADYPDHAFTMTGSKYMFRLYEQELSNLKKTAFAKGTTLYVVAYARPSQHASSRDGFGTEFKSEKHNIHLSDSFLKRYYTTIGRYPSAVRSFVLK